MTQEQLGIASGLLVVLLTAFWPMLSALDRPKPGLRDAGDTENPGHSSDLGPRRHPTAPAVESTSEVGISSPETIDTSRPSRPSTGPTAPAVADPLTSALPDLSRSS